MREIELPPTCDQQMQSRCDDFLALFSRHSRRSYGYVRTLVLDVNDSNDVFQNATLCMWRKFHEFSIGTNFFAWACRIVHLEVLKFKEKQRPQLFFSEDVINLLAQQLIDNGNELGSREAALNDCVKKLSRPDRQMLELRYYKERKPKQIAVAQSRSVFSVYRSLSRIHDQLFRCIERALSETSPS
jgi:RNA polymerase sigma-70 factor (ECF subfamily)